MTDLPIIAFLKARFDEAEAHLEDDRSASAGDELADLWHRRGIFEAVEAIYVLGEAQPQIASDGTALERLALASARRTMLMLAGRYRQHPDFNSEWHESRLPMFESWDRRVLRQGRLTGGTSDTLEPTPDELIKLRTVHPELVDATVTAPAYYKPGESRPMAGVWETVLITLTLGPFIQAIMAGYGGAISGVSQTALRKAVGKFLREREEGTNRALEGGRGFNRQAPDYAIALRPDGLNVSFILPLKDKPDRRTAAALMLLEVDISAFGTDEVVIVWDDDTWEALIHPNPGIPTIMVPARWQPTTRQWIFPNGEAWRSPSASPEEPDAQ
ncbi:hypothetical protein [Streptomyces sp. BA2]|uniref:hypothetical protein n=1 Tax=Streptomyces sp. BA2 TaxID=436595 RepID=UPI001326DCA3|nr:hypothetical protein [Streptomyces sp. BA2]MWA08119.1 hypothetical protein [Streptomyces sp. BA2]